MNSIIYPLLGGVLIGLSSSAMLGGLGRITGISGIIGASLKTPSKEGLWRYTFLLGLVLGGFILKIMKPELFNYKFDFRALDYIFAGLFVGFGTRLGSGCTSGHGICGISRMAKRSMLATVTFIVFGMISVLIKKALL